jgi:glycosyltransferase involved in cell wall biosynthesis
VRIVVFSERLRAPYDEGIKNVAAHLIQALAAEHEMLALTSQGVDDARLGLRNVDSNRMLLSPQLGGLIRRFQPQAIVYVPTACATPFALARARVLRHYGGGARTALLTLQPRRYTAWGRAWMRRLAPDLVLAQSRRTAGALAALGCHTALLPPAVDTQRFRAATSEEKAGLRARYGIPGAAQVVTHVGHLKGKRNLAQLLELQAQPGYHVVVVGSSSTEQDTALKEALRGAGVTLIDTYVERIKDVYYLSDAYLFLAEDETAAIEVPLSVLEALACNLPVVSTPFGGLPDFFAEGSGLHYWHAQTELKTLVQAALSAPCATRALVEARTWPAAAAALVTLLGSAPSELRGAGL